MPDQRLSLRDLQNLLHRAEAGDITKSELNAIAADLSDTAHLPLRIAILARSMDKRYLDVLGDFAKRHDDSDTAELALKYLIVAHKKLE
jgi:hypothetical protein